ncbi:septum formation initiator family protein [Patescibacteria group bacterium]|nr:septum formation initiator family protein [Patescibacteria group bacterium]
MASLSSRNPSPIPSLRWPLLFALLAAIVFFVGASTVRETYRGWKVDQEIEGLKSQVSQLEGQKHSMTELLGTMKTDAYIEQEARLRFNLKKPGEQVVLFEEGDSNTRMAWTEQSNATSSLALPGRSVSVPKRWLEYFINPRETRS